MEVCRKCETMVIFDKVANLYCRFSENLEWYVTTTNEVLLMSGDLVPQDSCHKVISTIQKGTPCFPICGG